MTTQVTAAPRRVGLVLALGGLLVVLDTTVVIVAIPALVADLDTTLPVVQWVTNGYVLALVAVLPTAAWAVNRFGARPVYLTGLAVFVAASALCAVAPGVGALIAFRALQGLGGGLLAPVGQVIALGSVPRERRGWMMSLLGLPVVVGPLLGPPVAGLLVDSASWRWIFGINVPLGIAALVLCARVLPSPAGRPASPLDRTGLALLPTAVVLVVLGLTVAGERGRVDTVSAVVLLAGVALGAVFVMRTLRVPDPLLRLRLLRSRPLAVGAASLFCVGAGYFGAMTIPAIFVQGVRGDPALLSGLIGIPAALATGLSLQVATRLVDRIDARRIVLTGITLFGLGTAALAAVVATNAPYALLIAAGALLGAGSGTTIMPSMTVALRDLSPADTPDGSTVLGLVQHTATAVGAAVVAGTLTMSLNSRGLDVGGMLALDDRSREAVEPGLAAAVGVGYAVPLALAVLALGVVATGRRRPSPGR